MDMAQFLTIFHGTYASVLGSVCMGVDRNGTGVDGKGAEWGGWLQRLKQRSKATQMIQLRAVMRS